MRIEKMKIENYRRFVETEINFSDKLTILVGANNSGKTSFVHLLDCVFGSNSTLKSKDISLTNQNSIIKKLFIMIKEKFDSSLAISTKQFQSDLLSIFFDKIDGSLLIKEKHISIEISVVYNEGESISQFADYLMDLDATKRNFYFKIIQEINPLQLKKNLELNTESLQIYLERYHGAIKKQEAEKPESDKYDQLSLQTNKNEQLFIENLFSVYGDSLELTYSYANEKFSLSHKMEKKDFISLFNYSYLSADRQLIDNNTENGKKKLTSSVVDLLNAEKENETSSNEWKGRIRLTLDRMFNAISDENIDTYLMDQAKTILDNISSNLNRAGETNIQEIMMVLDMGMDFLYRVLKESIRVNYAIPIGEKNEEMAFLTEESQGLGISNLIYITLELMSYKLTTNSGLINLFVIEEPESHMHLQMQRTLINFLNSEYEGREKLYNIQGIITTHSDEIVRSANLTDMKVIRPKAPLTNVIFDMSMFLEKHKTEKKFFETFFRINFSSLIFADKAIIYEGDTERMYMESLIFGNRKKEVEDSFDFLNTLSQKYITYAQAGGTYAHKYADLLNELEINTLIFTDIDYAKTCLNKDDVLKSKTTNEALKFFYEHEQEEATNPTQSVEKKEDEMNTYPSIDAIYKWQIIHPECNKVLSKAESDCTKKNNILVKTQSEADGYARTLEEAILFHYIKRHHSELLIDIEDESSFNVFTDLKRTEWKNLKTTSGFVLAIPNRNKREQDIELDKINRNIREIVDGISNNKSDFMYSIIMAEKQLSVIPTYIKEGLEWLAKK